MDFWNKARNFAEEAAKRSQELTLEAARRSQELTIGSSSLSDIVSVTAKRSKEFATEASKRADQIKAEAAKRADLIKHLVGGTPSSGALEKNASEVEMQEEDLQKFGINEELRDFVKGITMSTFRDFPLEDDSQVSNIPTVSNISQDLTVWQTKHASLVLSTVKEISTLRYELCPRIMKERKFWRIYFLLVNRHIAPYEKKYMEDVMLKSAKQVEDGKKEPDKTEITSNSHEKKNAPTLSSSDQEKKNAPTSSSSDQDLDLFLLGDLGDSDDGPDDGDEGFDDDFDKMVDSSDDEKDKL
ncbi:hypothetical protein SDJN02_14300 [Cucurbita argyrosperma subsp. argyrosperma]|uniref:Uncharacterized protein LOC111429736 isoform X1 n=1 Tax=Cucurbita moschata TaxID=3662 RepID=A0A6J1E5S1_CUCMO|nr:uncharacterized protein LOC111429736 isoform X1 [Cucurbita moschata]KAG7023275.1 hypothetical protein SDJN02_14300 [Cucurbita argyrosperma subsp. argyrosperma]